MDAEFFARRQWIIKLDIRTRIRETKAKYPVLGAGDQVLQQLTYILYLVYTFSKQEEEKYNTYPKSSGLMLQHRDVAVNVQNTKQAQEQGQLAFCGQFALKTTLVNSFSSSENK